MVFQQIEQVDLPPIGVENKWFGVNLTNPIVGIPTTSSNFNNDFDLELLANGTEPVLRIKSEKLPLQISSDWDMHFSILKSKGHIEADFVDLGFIMDIQLSSIINQQEEMGAMVYVYNTNFGFDQRKSNIKVTGKGLAAWTIKLVEDIFQKELFNQITREIKSILSTTL